MGRFSTLHMFSFTSLSMHELHNLQRFYWLRIGAHITGFSILPGFVQVGPQNSQQNHTTNYFARFHNHFLYQLWDN